ncbi:hypothetical protein V1227_06965 [Lentzea sp. DG1S-22]|uniref:hypothetical protein n=1 Tax=Lentzea sp. DG1S-22 TaxID=3108822 RepID=UPI002E78250E|nr:hypothetical protein [Lentzea sp. DG1S-22]WVH82491.1 hypothetical protein V1227_06965 [Lentzea sp. DG1S-22]
MSLRDAALILAHRELFGDLEGALVLVGAVLVAQQVEDRPAFPVEAVPFELADEQSWPLPSNDGWNETDLQADDAMDTARVHVESELDYEGDGPVAGAEDGAARTPVPRRKGSGMIARILEPEREDERGSNGQRSSSYRSVPPPGRQIPEMSEERSGFRMRTLPLTLQSMTRVPLRGNEPDIPAVLERLALAEPLNDVPMETRFGQPERIRVLCELGLQTGPYADDARLLQRMLRRLYGAERIDLRWFERSPAYGCGHGPVWTWQHCETPGAAEATVLVTQGVPSRWCDPQAVHEFAARLFAHGAAVCTVLLGPGSRVPRFRGYPQLLVND